MASICQSAVVMMLTGMDASFVIRGRSNTSDSPDASWNPAAAHEGGVKNLLVQPLLDPL